MTSADNVVSDARRIEAYISGRMDDELGRSGVAKPTTATAIVEQRGSVVTDMRKRRRQLTGTPE